MMQKILNNVNENLRWLECVNYMAISTMLWLVINCHIEISLCAIGKSSIRKKINAFSVSDFRILTYSILSYPILSYIPVSSGGTCV